MADGDCWEACRVEGGFRNRNPDSVARSSGKPKPAEGPWAYLACSVRAWEGSGAFQVDCPEEGDAGWEALRASRLDHLRRHRSRCLEWAQER